MADSSLSEIIKVLANRALGEGNPTKTPGGAAVGLAKGTWGDLTAALKLLRETAKKPYQNISVTDLPMPANETLKKTLMQSSPVITAGLAAAPVQVPTKITPAQAQPVKLDERTRQFMQILKDASPVLRTGNSLERVVEPKFVVDNGRPPEQLDVSQGLNSRQLLPLVKPNLPKFSEPKPLGDVAGKTALNYGIDVATDPLTWLGGAGSAGIKVIKTAAGPGVQIGKQTFEAFGEAVPRFAQMAGELLQKSGMKNIDPMAIYGALRSPSKLLDPKFLEIVSKFKTKMAIFTLTALERSKAWYALKDPALQEEIGKAVLNNNMAGLKKYVEGLVADKAPAVANMKEPVNDVLKIARGFRSLQSQAGKAAVDAGLLSKDTYEANKQTYMRQFYRYFVDHEKFMSENPTSGLAQFVDQPNISGQGAKVNSNLFKNKLSPEDFSSPEDYKLFQEKYGALGPENIGFSATRGSIMTNSAARTKQMFREIADSGIVKDVMPENALVRKKRFGQFGEVYLAKSGNSEYIKIPEDKGYAALSGKWMPRYEGQEIINTYKHKSAVTKSIEKLTSIWKTMKVPYSTTAQSRNFFISNPLLMTLSGINPIDSFTIATKALSTFAEKGFDTPAGQAYIRYGGLGKTFVNNDITPLLSTVKGTPSLARNVWQGTKDRLALPGKAYSTLEHAGKMAIMDYWHNKGFNWKQAFEKAQDTLFDYGDRSKLVEQVSKKAVPFVTFPAKALPYVAKQTLSNPARVLPAIALRDIINENEAKKLELTAGDMQLIRERYGNWFLITGGEKKKPEVIDLSYLVPATDLTGGEGRGLLPKYIPQGFQPSHPLLTLAEIAYNRSPYFDKPIVPSTAINISDVKKYIELLKQNAPKHIVPAKDIPYYLHEMKKRGIPATKAFATLLKNSKELYNAKASAVVLSNTRLADQIRHILRSWGPSSGFFPWSYQADALISALQNKPTFSGRMMTPIQALAQEFSGLKFNKLDLNQMRGIAISKNRAQIKELVKKIIQINKSSVPDKKLKSEHARDQIREKAKEIRDLAK